MKTDVHLLMCIFIICRIFGNTKTYLGFFIGWFEIFAVGINYNCCLYGFLLFYIGLHLYVNGFVLDLKALVSRLNAELLEMHRKTSKMKNISHFHQKLDVILTDTVLMHNDMLKYV